MQTSEPGFFDEEDAERRRRAIEEAEPYRVPQWGQAPEDEVPGRVLLDRTIARSERATLVLREIGVYSTGFEVVVDWVLRRRDESVSEWQRRAHGRAAFFGGEEGGGPRFGIVGPGGEKVPAVGFGTMRAAYGPDSDPNDAPTPPTAMPRHGGGGGSDRLYRLTGGLWVWWPEFPGGECRLVSEWRDEEFEASAVPLDGDAIVAARAAVRPLWE
ncbi:hypothetical protein ET445_03080 [Agromyces protaetiae]|uniref:Uncharacterized protein n=1 Tax=Agromyces protaetiae TaxID=2509455 RepID=A0A4P6FC22_9MICO|nr:hypothetical protein [Agromyces protaetiae]QAY72473.1 hypothetical protein ET445_03080 [Agromyces protaetiae]